MVEGVLLRVLALALLENRRNAIKFKKVFVIHVFVIMLKYEASQMHLTWVA